MPLPSPVARWWTDPLGHFLLFGVLVVGVDAAFSGGGSLAKSAPAAKNIVQVTDEVVQDLQRNLAVTLERPPTSAEVDRAVEHWIDQEVLLAEAMALGLHDNDPIVRTRLAEKMAFLLGAQQVPPEPDEAALRALYDAHKQDYTQAAKLTLRQLAVADTSPQGQARAEQLLRRAEAGEPLEALTAAADDPPGGPVLRARTPESLAARYGAAFVQGLEDLALGSWALRRSDHGWHAVQVQAREPGGPLAYEAVRTRLLVRWRRNYADTARDKAVAALRSKAAVQGWPR